MSKIILKLQNLSRLSKICENNFAIRFEILNHKVYGIASNDSVGIVEFLGESDDMDGVCHIIINDKLAEYIKNNLYSETNVIIETIPEIATGTLTCGDFLETSCFIWPESTPLDNWKSWLVPDTDKSTGFMFWNVYQVQKLFEASPSGDLVFPEFFDSSKPVLIRDNNDSRWAGFFIPKAKTKQVVKPATKPDWWAE